MIIIECYAVGNFSLLCIIVIFSFIATLLASNIIAIMLLAFLWDVIHVLNADIKPSIQRSW
ncbi:hypothetical protein GGI43DRAFT_405865 [Trichoderma evansii]